MMMRLAPTERFGVWSCSDVPATPLKHEEDLVGQVVLGARRTSLHDLVRVAGLQHTVSCDKSALDGMAVGLESLVLLSASFETVSIPQDRCIPMEACRAILVVILCHILHGQSAARPGLALFLTRLLNAQVIPAFTTKDTYGTLLAALANGLDVLCYTRDGMDTSRLALAQAKVRAFPLSESEAKLLQSDAFYTLGIACLTTGGAYNLSHAIDCIAAVSCEAYGADVSKFDATYFETVRQQRGQINSASNLRNLLEGSKRLSNAKFSRCFAIIPQVNGPSQEVIAAASRCAMGFSADVFT